MLGKMLSLGLAIFMCFLSGCIETPPSPLSSIPRIFMDHIQETDETKVYVNGLDDHLYSNITIQINNETLTENFTYSLHASILLIRFAMNVTVWDEAKQYEYLGNFTVIKEDDRISLEIADYRYDEPIERSLPYSIIMERRE